MTSGITNHETIMDITLCISKWKANGQIPSTIRLLMRMLRKEVGGSFTERAVKNCCDKQGVVFRRTRAASEREGSYLRGKQAKSVAWTIRQIIHNIESSTGMESGTLLDNGVREALVAIIAGKNVGSDSFADSVDEDTDDAPSWSGPIQPMTDSPADPADATRPTHIARPVGNKNGNGRL